MTLILAVGCGDGVVIASDSAVSESGTGTKLAGEKIQRLEGEPILYASSGHGGLRQRVDEALKSFKPNPQLKQIRNKLKSLVVSELDLSAKQHVPYPEPPYDKPPVVIFLFVGVHKGKPWILEIERDGSDTLYDDRTGNFAAIGSAKGLAHALFRPHLRSKRTLKEGKVLAYRVTEDSIHLMASGLSEPVHIHVISADGTVSELKDGPDRKEINDTVNLWRELERETLGRALSPESQTQESPPPKPETKPAPA